MSELEEQALSFVNAATNEQAMKHFRCSGVLLSIAEERTKEVFQKLVKVAQAYQEEPYRIAEKTEMLQRLVEHQQRAIEEIKEMTMTLIDTLPDQEATPLMAKLNQTLNRVHDAERETV